MNMQFPLRKKKRVFGRPPLYLKLSVVVMYTIVMWEKSASLWEHEKPNISPESTVPF